MAQPAPATEQNTNMEEDDEVLCEEYAEDESPTLTLASIPRVETSIDVDAKCIGALRALQGVKAAEKLGALRYLTLDTPDDELRTRKAQILEQRRKNVEFAAHPYLHSLGLRGVGASARDAACYDDVRHAGLKHLERHYKQKTITTSELRDAERNLKRIADAAKRDAALLKSWDEKHQQREDKAIEEMEDLGVISWGALRNFNFAMYGESIKRRVKTLEDIVDTGKYPGGATSFGEVYAGGVHLRSFVYNNNNGTCSATRSRDNVLATLFEVDDGKLGEQLAALATPKERYDKLIKNHPFNADGYLAARSIQRLALMCKKWPDTTPIDPKAKELVSHVEELPPLEQTYKLYELRNHWIMNGVDEEEANQVLLWEVLANKTNSQQKFLYRPSENSRGLYIFDTFSVRDEGRPSKSTLESKLQAVELEDEGARMKGRTLLNSKHLREQLYAFLRFKGVDSSRAEQVLTWTVKHKKDQTYYVDDFLKTQAKNEKAIGHRFGVRPKPADKGKKEVLTFLASVWCEKNLRYEKDGEIAVKEFFDLFLEDPAATDWPPEKLDKIRTSKMFTTGKGAEFAEWRLLKTSLHDAFPDLTKDGLIGKRSSDRGTDQFNRYLIIRGVVPRKPYWRELTVGWCRANLQYMKDKSVSAHDVRDRFSKEAANFGWPLVRVQNLAAGMRRHEFQNILKPAVITACSADGMDDSDRPWYDEKGFRNVTWKKEPSSGAQPNVHAPAPAPSDLDSDDEKDRNMLDRWYPSSKAEQISGSAPAPAPVALDSSDDDDDDSEASAKEYERFMTEQEAKLYGQIGSPDEKKESDSLSSDEPKYLGTNPPPADAAAISMYDFGVHPNAPPPAVAPVPVAAPAQVEVAEEPTPASSPRPPRDLDLVDSEEAKKVGRDYDDEAVF